MSVGLSLPLKNGDGGFFEQNFTTFEQSQEVILKTYYLLKKVKEFYNLILVVDYKIYYLNQSMMNSKDKLVDTVTESVQTWLPYINIEDIDVNMNDENKDNNRVGVEIKFKVGDTLDLNSVTFTVFG